MMTKIFIIFVMLIIVASLGSGLISLIRDSAYSRRTVKALTIRITISLSLFILLFLAFKFGFISPHGI